MNSCRRDAGARELRRQGHRETAGMSRAQKLFRIRGRFAFFKTRLERVRTFKRAAPDFQCSTALRQITFPFSFCFSCWHVVLSLLLIVGARPTITPLRP